MQGVPLPTDRIGCGGNSGQFVAKEVDQLAIGGRRVVAGHGQIVGQTASGCGAVRGGPGGESDEEGATRVGQFGGLLDALIDLQLRWHHPSAHAFAQ